MLNKIKKLFFDIEMTWPRLIIFSIVLGLYTAAVLMLPIFKNTAFTEIGVGYEMWILLAIFVISNCKSYKEAAIKCFVFFLISQPLIYIVQDIILHEDFLKSYYYPWFIQTILTIPGAMIAYQIKRNDLLGMIVLLIGTGAVSFMGTYFFVGGIMNQGVHYSFSIYGILLIVASIILGFVFVDNKKLRRIYIGIITILVLVTSIVFIKNYMSSGSYTYELSKEDWFITSGGFDQMSVEVVDDELVIEYYASKAIGDVVLENKDGVKKELHIVVNNKVVEIKE